MKFGRLLFLAILLVGCGGQKKHDLTIMDQSELKFGAVDVTQSKTNTLTIENNGKNSIILQKFSIQRSDEVFVLNDSDATCTEGLELAPTATCVFTVTFSPNNNVNFVEKLSVSFSTTEETDEASWKLKTFNLEGLGKLNCSLKTEWADSYQVGVNAANKKMSDETIAAKASAESKTYGDGYAHGYDKGFEETYTTSYNSAYDTAYDNAFSYHYTANRNDYFTCLDARGDAEDDAEDDADYDAYIEGTNDGYEDGYDAYNSIGYYDGYDDGIYYCDDGDDYDYDYSSTRPERSLESPVLDPSLGGKCEAQGMANTYDPAHYYFEYLKFLEMNEDFKSGLSVGTTQGKADGREQGKANGTTDGKAAGKTDGTIAALEDQYQECYADEYASEYNYEYNRLYSYYYNSAYDVGSDEGYDDGFDEGYSDAESDCGYSSEEASQELASNSAPESSPLIKLLSSRENLVVKAPNGRMINVSKAKTKKLPLVLSEALGAQAAQYTQSVEDLKKYLRGEYRKTLSAKKLHGHLEKFMNQNNKK